MLPLIALVIAALLSLAWILVRGWLEPDPRTRALPVGVSGVWVTYAMWERFAVSPGDNIRVDLVLIYPVLLGVTIAAILALVGMRNRR